MYFNVTQLCLCYLQSTFKDVKDACVMISFEGRYGFYQWSVICFFRTFLRRRQSAPVGRGQECLSLCLHCSVCRLGIRMRLWTQFYISVRSIPVIFLEWEDFLLTEVQQIEWTLVKISVLLMLRCSLQVVCSAWPSVVKAAPSRPSLAQVFSAAVRGCGTAGHSTGAGTLPDASTRPWPCTPASELSVQHLLLSAGSDPLVPPSHGCLLSQIL